MRGSCGVGRGRSGSAHSVLCRLAKYLCTAPEVVDSALQGWRMSPQRAGFTLKMLLAAEQRQAEVAEIYFEGETI